MSKRTKRKQAKNRTRQKHQTSGAKLIVAKSRIDGITAHLTDALTKNKNAVNMNRILRDRLEQYRVGQFCPDCSLLWYNVKLSACPNCGQTDLEEPK